MLFQKYILLTLVSAIVPFFKLSGMKSDFEGIVANTQGLYLSLTKCENSIENHHKQHSKTEEFLLTLQQAKESNAYYKSLVK